MESSSSSLLLSSYTGNNKRSREADLEAVSSAEVDVAKRMRPEDLLDLLDDHTDAAAADDLASVMRSLEEEICTGDLALPQPELRFLEMGADMTVNCVHPGIVRTRLNRDREGLIPDLVFVLLSKLLRPSHRLRRPRATRRCTRGWPACPTATSLTAMRHCRRRPP